MQLTWLEKIPDTVFFAFFSVLSIMALTIGYLFSMPFFQIIGILIGLALVNTIHSTHLDKKTLVDLRWYLITHNSCLVELVAIAGYGGGNFKFANGKNFSFYSNDYMYPAAKLISSSPFQIVSAVWI